jgi:hypothetical protein
MSQLSAIRQALFDIKHGNVSTYADNGEKHFDWIEQSLLERHETLTGEMQAAIAALIKAAKKETAA